MYLSFWGKAPEESNRLRQTRVSHLPEQRAHVEHKVKQLDLVTNAQQTEKLTHLCCEELGVGGFKPHGDCEGAEDSLQQQYHISSAHWARTEIAISMTGKAKTKMSQPAIKHLNSGAEHHFLLSAIRTRVPRGSRWVGQTSLHRHKNRHDVDKSAHFPEDSARSVALSQNIQQRLQENKTRVDTIFVSFKGNHSRIFTRLGNDTGSRYASNHDCDRKQRRTLST